jgi:hypothetical protein
VNLSETLDPNQQPLTSENQEISEMFTRYIDAELKRFALGVDLGGYSLLRFNERDGFINRQAKRLVANLYHGVYSLGEKETEVRFSQPATWVDAFKEYYKWQLPSWMRIVTRNWKVNHRVTIHKVTARALLPDLPITLGEHKVRFVVYSHPSFTQDAAKEP